MIQLFQKRGSLEKRMARISLVACDLDGTLLDDSSTLSPHTVRVIKEAQEQGLRVALASGRTPIFTSACATELGITMPVISLNGAIVTSMTDGSKEYNTPVPKGIMDLALNVLDQGEPQVTFAAFTHTGCYATNESMQVPKYLRQRLAPIKALDDLERIEDDTALLIAFGPYTEMQTLSVQIARKYGALVKRIFYPSRTTQGMHYLELVHAKANKGNALSAVCKSVGISKSEVAAIGDFANDAEMLRFASVSAAMNNAIDEIKQIADLTTDSANNEDGAAEFITRILEAKRKT